MAFVNDGRFKPFDKKVWLASPTMHGDEMQYVKEAYETNWMSTVGANINEVEKQLQKNQRQSMQWHYLAVQQRFIFV